MGNLQNFLDVVVSGIGIYMIYSAIKLKRTKIIDSTFLLPKNVDKNKCKDVEGYIKYMFPKFLLSAIIITIGGILGVINDYYISFGQFYFIIFLIVLVALGYLMVTSTKALKMYF